MTLSRDDLYLVEKLEERGYSREQVTMWLSITDTMVTVTQRGANLVRNLFPLRPERGR